MHIVNSRGMALWVGTGLGLLSLCLAPTPAQARGMLLFGPQISSAAMFLLGSGSHCVGFTYDLNGNRVAQTAATMGSGAVLWGAGSYGCFLWTQ